MSEQDPMFDMMIKVVMVVAGVLVVAPTFQRIFSDLPSAQTLRAQQYIGKTSPFVVQANDKLQWLDPVRDFPYIPWIRAYFINDGPGDVQVGINHPDDLMIMGAKETLEIDRTNAQENIWIIFFLCPRGEKAQVRVTGEY